jgi:hypothetical protein
MDGTGETAVYEIRIRGHLDGRRARQFSGMTVTPLPDGNTLIAGPVADQAALYGLLSRIRNLGTPLLSLQRQEEPGANAANGPASHREETER